MITKFDTTTQNILTELEKTQRQFWNIARVSAEFMYILIKEENIKNAIEIGTSNGYSGIWLGKERLSVAKENFKHCGLEDVIIPRQGDACEILNSMPEDVKIDFAFIDANKREYIKYFEILDPHIRVGGYIACDNVLSHEEKCRTYIEAIDANPNYENVVLALPAGLSLARKLK